MNDNKKQLCQALKFTLFSVSAGVIQIHAIKANPWYIISPFTDNTIRVTFVKGDLYI